MKTREERIEEVQADLISRAKTLGYTLTPDRRVSENDAAGLLHMSPHTLKAWRQKGYRTPPKFTRINIGKNRISYYIYDIAEWLIDSISDIDI